MKKAKLLKKTFGILICMVGITTFFSACHKERDCKCKEINYNNDRSTFIVTTKEQCWELDYEVEEDGDIVYSVECEKD